MRHSVRRLVLTAGVAVVIAVIAAGAALADQSYPDATGDAGSGSDISGITVRNDQAGLISIQVATVNPIVANHALFVFIDADKNPSTGGQGDEYWMYGGPLVGVGFFGWNGSDFVEQNPGSFLVGPAAANVTEFRINRADIGNVTSFNLFVMSASVDESGGGFQVKAWDGSPEVGYHTYDLSFPQCSNTKDDDGDGKVDAQDLGCSSTTDNDESDDPVNIRLGKAKVVPAKPKSGKTVTVSAPLTRVETGQAPQGASVKCTARVVGGKTLKGTGSMAGGRAVCKVKLPAKTEKKTVRGQIAVTYETASAKVPFTFKIAA
jgi:hypothetical protein